MESSFRAIFLMSVPGLIFTYRFRCASSDFRI